MKILITGNMGYVGPGVVRHLRAAYPDSHLIGVDAGFFAHCLTTTESLPERRLTTQHFLDVRDLPDEIFAGVDAVVQLAAISNDPMGNAFEAITSEVNWKASVRVAHQAKNAGARRFVFASSCSIYGLAEGGARNEDAATNPLTAYARSKVATEDSLQDLANADFVITCLRFPTACGMSDRLRLDLVLNDFVASAVAAGKIQILSDGSPWRPLIDVRDMARAIEWGIIRDRTSGGQFLAINVGRADCNYQVRDLAHAIQELMPSLKIEINENAQPDKRSYQVSFDLFSELAPAHVPRFGLTETIMDLKNGLEAIGFADEQFRDSDFVRLKVLSDLRNEGYLDESLRWTSRNHKGES